MSWTAPTLSTPRLLASEVKAASQGLREWEHGGILATDLVSGRWVESRHILQPEYNPLTCLQTGVTGLAGGVDSSTTTGYGPLDRLAFFTSDLAGRRAAFRWQPMPGTSYTLDIRTASYCLFHFYIEVEAGPDTLNTPSGYTWNGDDNRFVTFAPYIGRGTQPDLSFTTDVTNTIHGFNSTGFGVVPRGVDRPYSLSGYGQRSGVHHQALAVGRYEVGLSFTGDVQRAAIVNWRTMVEVYSQ